MRRKGLAIGLVLLAVVAALAGAVRAIEGRRLRSSLDEARRAIAERRYGTAQQLLSTLAERWPADGEVLYQLGVCAQARGRGDEAIQMWAQVPASSPFAQRAAVGRAMILIDRGRFAPAEELLGATLRTAGPDADEVRQALNLLFRFQVRTEDVRQLLIASWGHTPDPTNPLKQLHLLENSAFPLETVRATLERGDAADDRVQLARANLAIRSGVFDEAARLLEACAERRPRDVAVWRSRLDLALAQNDAANAWLALTHLPAARTPRAQVLELRAWLAARQGKPEMERQALVELIEANPGRVAAVDRLATLAFEQGAREDAIRYRKLEAEINRSRDRYRALMARDDRDAHARELAELAGRLGHTVESRGWSLIADRGARLAVREPLVVPAGDARLPGSLADLLGDLRPESGTDRSDVSSNAGIAFTDDAQASGLQFDHDNGHTRKRPPPPETMSGGVGLLDYDGDGWLDVYAVQGGTFPPSANARAGDRLFRNRGDGTFEDATSSSGMASFAGGYGHGVAVGDFDNDGWPDLLVTRWRSYALYRNKGDGTFEDVTASSGLGGARDWPTSAAWADLDGDGDLDLYVCHYLAYDPANPRRCAHPETNEYHECSPRDFEALSDHVFRNDGGRFVDATAGSGMEENEGRGLGVVAAHLDDDDKIDLYVANDLSANFFYCNQGGLRFENTAVVAGVAGSANGGYQAGMGVACGDLNRDGLADLAVTNFFGESTTFFQNLGHGIFADRTAAIGLAAPSRFLLGFGVAFVDVNNDGRLDVMTANGHIHDGRPRYPWMMPVQLLAGGVDGHLTDVSRQAGAPFEVLRLGRGLAAGDLDNDGRVDVVVLGQNAPLAYFHNGSRAGRSLTLRLEGRQSNRDAVGARVTLRAGGTRQVAQRVGGGSYQSAGDPRLHFGLGEHERVDSLEVVWPSGRRDVYRDLAPGGYRLREGERALEPLKGWGRSTRESEATR
jgi:tetratricopeptide (TPR) repeat protein